MRRRGDHRSKAIAGRWPRRLACALVALGACSATVAQQRFTVLQETWVTVQARLVLTTSTGTVSDATETVTGKAGDALAWSAQLGRGAVNAGLAFVVEVDTDTGLATAKLQADVQLPRQRPVTLTRVLTLAPERAALCELWSDAQGSRRLVLVLSAAWTSTPQISALLPGAEPIEFLIELVARVKDEVRVLEDHRLRGIVGSPVRLAFEHAAQRPLAAAAVAPAGAGADAPSAPADGNLALEIMPLSLRDGRLHLKALIRSSGLRKDAPGDMTASSGEDVLPPGYALELPLPPVPGVPPLAVHVTAFF